MDKVMKITGKGISTVQQVKDYLGEMDYLHKVVEGIRRNPDCSVGDKLLFTLLVMTGSGSEMRITVVTWIYDGQKVTMESCVRSESNSITSEEDKIADALDIVRLEWISLIQEKLGELKSWPSRGEVPELDIEMIKIEEIDMIRFREKILAQLL
jgi:hypothetical protein